MEGLPEFPNPEGINDGFGDIPTTGEVAVQEETDNAA